MCLHGRQRASCQECVGTQVCRHNKNKSLCKECGFAVVCRYEGCTNLARRDPMKKDQDSQFCIRHGGGRRCQGLNNDGCPLNAFVHQKCQAQIWYDGLCTSCFIVAFPDDDRTKNAKKQFHAREHGVREHLEKRYSQTHPNLKWVMDRRVDGTRRRPDHRPLVNLIGIESHDVIVETDESSHWFYLCADEREKEKLVHQHLNGCKRPLIWIRFNPDAYDHPVTGQRVPTPWAAGKDGVFRVKDACKLEWEQRLDKLCQVLDEFLVDRTEDWAALPEELRPSQDLFLPIELFYDDVLEKRGEAEAAFRAIKTAAKKRRV